MATKIIKILIDPEKIYTGSNFLLKIKAIRYVTYEELKTKTYNQVKNYTYSELKGE